MRNVGTFYLVGEEGYPMAMLLFYMSGGGKPSAKLVVGFKDDHLFDGFTANSVGIRWVLREAAKRVGANTHWEGA